MPEATGGARLSDLESRWRFDRSPRVFLQLADELRRAGSLSRAIEVLQEGLNHHPESVSGRVALGRAQLEAGDAGAAAETLERVLARDPAQIVASKLLIETWIRMGDAARARERLDIYRILQERDGEIDEYERRIAGMERSERQPAVLELAGVAAPAPSAQLAENAEPETASETPAPLFDLGPTRELRPLELLPELERSRAAGTTFDLETPFGRIHEPVSSGARILSYFRSEALFLAPVPAAESAVAGPVAATPVVSTLFAFEAAVAEATLVEEAAQSPAMPAPSGAVAAAGVEPLETLESVVEPVAEPESRTLAVPPPAPEPASELAPGMSFEQFSTTGFAAEVERESLIEPLADVLGRAGIDAEALPRIVHPSEAAGSEASAAELDLVGSGAELLEPSAKSIDETLEMISAAGPRSQIEPTTIEGAAPVAAASAAELPSGTLAGLYLEQGHLAEAEEEFRRVLASRPDDEAALAGLREVARRRASDETISGWAAAAPVAPQAPRPHRAVGLTQRKVETLRHYLDRIRRGRVRAHVS